MVAKLELLDTAMARLARLETASSKIHERANIIYDGQEVFQSTAKKLADAQEANVDKVRDILHEKLDVIVETFVNRTRTNEGATDALERDIAKLREELNDLFLSFVVAGSIAAVVLGFLVWHVRVLAYDLDHVYERERDAKSVKND